MYEENKAIQRCLADEIFDRHYTAASFCYYTHLRTRPGRGGGQ